MEELEQFVGYELIRRILTEKYRHPSLKRADEMRSLLVTVLTNRDYQNLLVRYERRQSEDQFKQQIKITNATLSSIGKRLVRRFVKAARVTGIDKRIEIEKNEAATTRLQTKCNTFYENRPIENYLLRFVDLYGLIDANAFVALHFKPFETGSEPVVYPVLWPCTQVHDFRYSETGILDYLIVSMPKTIRTKGTDGRTVDKKVTDYLQYERGRQTLYTEIVEGRQLPEGEVIQFDVLVKPDRLLSDGNKLRYIATTFETNTNEVPVMRLGYETDPEDLGLCVSPLFAAEPHFKDYVRLKSNLDVTMLLHVYQRLFQYVEKCPGENPAQGITCQSGKRFATDIECTKCKGKGYTVHDNGMDVVYLPLPDNPAEIIPLDKLAFYLTPEISVVDKLENQLNSLEYHKIPITIFGTELLQRVDGSQGVSKTATETNLNADQVSDTLRPFVEQRSLIYKFLVRQIALFNDIADSLTVNYEYPADLAVETTGELLDQLKKANDSGANSHVTELLSDRVARTMLRDKPRDLLRYEVQRRFLPLNGKNADERTYLLASELVPKRTKVLFANFDSIIDELVEEGQENRQDFMALPYGEQNALIDAKLETLMQTLESERPAPILTVPFGNRQQQPPTQTGTN